MRGAKEENRNNGSGRSGINKSPCLTALSVGSHLAESSAYYHPPQVSNALFALLLLLLRLSLSAF